MPARKIIHVDMDAFFASVEQLDHPEYRGKPVIVGGDPQSRGVVATASYEARKFGVHSAMSSAEAHRLCPRGIFVHPNFSRYVEISDQIHAIFCEVTPLVESLSLDEAFLDVTENQLNEPLARNIAIYIKDRIAKELQLTASAGVGPNKLIAKIASDFHKPNGLTVIPPQRVTEFLDPLPVEKLWGVGPVTAAKLHSLGLKKVKDIRSADPEMLEKALGSYGPFLFEQAQGIDERPVEPHHEPKSRGAEVTFEKDVTDVEKLLTTLREQATEVQESLLEMDRPGRTVTIKVRYSDFTTITRSRTFVDPLEDEQSIYGAAAELLLNHTEAGHRPVRLVGLSVGGLVNPEEPLQLWLKFKERFR